MEPIRTTQTAGLRRCMVKSLTGSSKATGAKYEDLSADEAAKSSAAMRLSAESGWFINAWQLERF
jgi:hypothetical protein